MRRLAIAAAAALALAGCILGGCKGQPEAGKVAGSAEVLPGSASDAMIAYDTLRSQPPLAPEENPNAPVGERDPGALAEPDDLGTDAVDTASATPAPPLPGAADAAAQPSD